MNKNVLLGGIAVVLVLLAFGFWQRRSTPSASPSLATPSDSQAVTIKGSDTEVQLVSNLVEAYINAHPGVDISVTGGGSGVGIAALINGEIDMANSSRAMTEAELMQAKNQGHDVQTFVVARDGLSIITHPSNPVKHLSLDQISQMYQGKITNWQQVGGANEPIVLYGRQSTSGTYTFFRDSAVKADYASTMRSMEGNQSIVDAVKNDKNGIGYVGVGYIKDEQDQPRSDIKSLPIATSAQTDISPLDEAAVANGTYPLARPIYQYLATKPSKESVIGQLLQFEASDAGQAIVKKAGFYALSAADIAVNEPLLNQLQ